jgi:hypothetical protein
VKAPQEEHTTFIAASNSGDQQVNGKDKAALLTDRDAIALLAVMKMLSLRVRSGNIAL